MSEVDSNENELPMPTELETLKQRADLVGLTYHPSISAEKLKIKLNEHLEKLNGAAALTPAVAAATEDSDTGNEVVVPDETVSQQRLRIKREALKLNRVRITCMNPNKREWEGEIFTCGNKLIGSQKRFIPFNVVWHVPTILLDMIKERKCQVFITERDARGNKTRKGKLINEFAVEAMPALTERQLKELAQRQAMSAGTAEAV